MAPKLQWVIFGDAKVHVSHFAGLPVGKRPVVFCPICTEKVTMKLGSKVAHHCAHRPGAVCATMVPESALHLNAKMHLAQILERISKLTVRQRCIRYQCDTGGGCQNFRVTDWVADWTSVNVEVTLGSRKPDILLEKGGVPVAAIEIFATHAVDAKKAADLAKYGVPWFEVRASEELYSGDTAWMGDRPLEGFGGTGLKSWLCPDCAEQEAKERYRRENGSHNRLVRIVDYYYNSGKKYRDLYYVVEHRRNGVVEELSLERRGAREEVVRVCGPASPSAMKLLTDAYKNTLASIRKKGAIIDSPMSWCRANELLDSSNLIVYAGIHFPYRYRWNRRQRVWFIPRDLRGLNWDNPF